MSKRKGAAGFEEYYGSLLGDRWSSLRDAMLGEGTYRELRDGLTKPYYLDEASFSAAAALEPSGGHRLLDLCAAPGGKSLVLATGMQEEARLTCNERSASRRARLHRVLSEHLPRDVRDRIEVTGHDARTWGLHERNRYDRVLADVPCSSERHVLASPSHMGEWGPGRSKRLAAQSVAILAAAVDTAAVGGFVVYSTCTVLEAENDDVVQRVLVRRPDVVELVPPRIDWGEPTRVGVRIWPDTASGRGPIFVARLRKTREN
jgi:16S rRNA C967 or C1407 C5-methylase (RsmB/RsmF family)